MAPKSSGELPPIENRFLSREQCHTVLSTKQQLQHHVLGTLVSLCEVVVESLTPVKREPNFAHGPLLRTRTTHIRQQISRVVGTIRKKNEGLDEGIVMPQYGLLHLRNSCQNRMVLCILAWSFSCNINSLEQTVVSGSIMIYVETLPSWALLMFMGEVCQV